MRDKGGRDGEKDDTSGEERKECGEGRAVAVERKVTKTRKGKEKRKRTLLNSPFANAVNLFAAPLCVFNLILVGFLPRASATGEEEKERTAEKGEGKAEGVGREVRARREKEGRRERRRDMVRATDG
jgi:hypothetical protein